MDAARVRSGIGERMRPSREDAVVVIGSGPAGAMAAYQLVSRGVPVTMLEAGTADPNGLLIRAAGRNLYRRTSDLEATDDWVATGDPSTRWYRTRQLGGLSNQWTGAVPRFAPEDFTDGLRLHVKYRWPLDYHELVPYYERAERLLVITGAGRDAAQLPGGLVYRRRTLPADWRRMADLAAARGQALVPMPLADGRDFMVARRAEAFNSYARIVRGLTRSPLFELRRGCTALRLDWSEPTRKVAAVVCQSTHGHEQWRVRGAGFVVACGPLASTKLLFDSACPSFPEGIGNQRGNLGRYLHDHAKQWWSVELTRPLSRMSPAAYLTRRPFAASDPLVSTSWTIGVTGTRDRVLSLLPGKSPRLGVQVFGSMVPTEDGFVRPHRGRLDRFGLPRLEIHLAFDRATVENVTRARDTFLSLLDEAGCPPVMTPEVPPCTPGESVHYGGTARMHLDPEYGVVDRWSRVFDVPNVVVADASTFTTSSEKNPTLTVMALAARAVDRLALDLRSGTRSVPGAGGVATLPAT